MAPQTLTMQTAEFHRVRDIIYQRTGIFLPESRVRSLEARLSPRIAQLDLESFDHYIRLLTIGPHQDAELQEALARLDISDTGFFQDLPQLEHFERAVLPALLDARAEHKRLRIWSAACASGEEPYTIAMLVHRALGVRLADWHIQILGTDISQKLLAHAEAAVYPPDALRPVSPAVQDGCFARRGASWAVDPVIRSMVTFELHNLRNAMGARRLGTWDVIFCRNILAWFDTGLRAQIVQTFHNQLAPGGHLLVGHHDITRECDGLLAKAGPPHAHAFTK